ncbi:MAG: peptidylprolyl isomerase [Flavobacteriales bacterium]
MTGSGSRGKSGKRRFYYHCEKRYGCSYRGRRNTGGSQFFIVHSREATAHLDRNHTCFGKISNGIEFVTQIQQGDRFSVEIID